MTPRSGYTLPVFACASALAALRHLHQEEIGDTVTVDLIEPPEKAVIPLEQVARIWENVAIAITRSDPGDNLDLTRNTPIWAMVEFTEKNTSKDQIIIQGGEGIGKQINNEGKAAIYRYAQKLIRENLQPFLKPDEYITITIILPDGRQLGQRTSNEAFGIVEGLSLLGTTGISQPLSATNQLAVYQAELEKKAQQFETLVFCIGENGLDLARQIGIPTQQQVKTANWIGPMLVTAALQGVKGIILLGYHGKLIKLAGGIFHTHHYLADGRLEILTAHLAQLGVSTPILQRVFNCSTTEAALIYLREVDRHEGTNWVEQVYLAIASKIEQRSQEYIRRHTEKNVLVGAVLFERDRSILIKSQNSLSLLKTLVIEKTNDN